MLQLSKTSMDEKKESDERKIAEAVAAGYAIVPAGQIPQNGLWGGSEAWHSQ